VEKKLQLKKDNTTPKKRIFFKEVSQFVRWTSALIFVILGYGLARSTIFQEYPFFGFNTIFEVILAILISAFGYYIFPDFLVGARDWIEETIRRTVYEIVFDFWDQQTRRIQDARREKQAMKAKEEAEMKEMEYQKAVLVDTSALIDGRILDVAKTGFFERNILLHPAVVNELHLLSDNENKLKRQRGRRGLDVASALKKHVKVLNVDGHSDNTPTDQQLVAFAKAKRVPLMTLDFNLNKVANVAGIRVLNINDLVNGLKTVLLPSEEIIVQIVGEGKEKGQGLGYLSDGTMIVVKGAGDKKGQEVKASVQKVLQSTAGRMIFCNLMEE
jgi:uncharacterized protein YacL